MVQGFSYRRFFASRDASPLIWTHVEHFGQLLYKILMPMFLKNSGFGHLELKTFPGGRSPDPPGVLLDASYLIVTVTVDSISYVLFFV